MVSTLQGIIETPECHLLEDGDLPSGRLRLLPGQQTDFSDAYYAKKHLPGETLEKRGRKQERDRLVIERSRLRTQMEQLKSDLASAAFYANASPIKQGGRIPTPIVSERVKEGERAKRRYLQDAEDTLRRYDELLEPRESYKFQTNGSPSINGSSSKSTTVRLWTSGGKGAVLILTRVLSTITDERMHDKGVPPPPQGVSPTDFLKNPQPQQTHLSATQRKLEASRSADSIPGVASTSRSASPALSSLPYSISAPPQRYASASSRAGNVLNISFKPIRTSPNAFASILSTDIRPSQLAYPPTSGAMSNDEQALRSSDKRRPGRPLKSIPLPLTLSLQGNQVGTDNLKLTPAASPKRRKRRKPRGHTSDEDDGKKDAVRLMKASTEFSEDYGSFLNAQAHGLHSGTSVQSEADDGDTEDTRLEMYHQRGKMTKEEREKYWIYKGPPTIKDSFFRTSAAAAAAAANDPSSFNTSSKAVSGSPSLSASLTRFAFGHKVPEMVCAATKEFSIAPILSEKEAQDKGINPVPSARPLTLVLPKILIDRAPTGRFSNDGSLARLPRLPSTRASSPNPINGVLSMRNDRHRRVPRIFRVRPVSHGIADLSLKKKALIMAATAQQKAANVFDTDGELSSISSEISDSENQDSDAKFRLERATKRLEPSDVTPFPSFLSTALPLSPALSASSRLPGVNGDAGLFTDNAESRNFFAPTSLPLEPQDSPDVIIINGMRVRKRVRLDDFPTNELMEVDNDQMAIFRKSYEHASGKRQDALGLVYTAMPIGEWQIRMLESDMRGS